MSYTPRGGYAKAAIDYITEHGPQLTGPLAEGIGCDPKSLQTLLEAALQHGLLIKEKADHMGRIVNRYSLGTGAPLPREKDEPLHPYEPQQAKAASKKPKREQDTNLAAHNPQPASEPAPAFVSEPEIECALTSTGRLLIDTGDRQIALSRGQADQLIAYLDKARGFEWEVA